jgi:hypothetical protein
MVHLLIHMVDDVIHLGAPFLHNMMPFERLNGVLNGYVHNRARGGAVMMMLESLIAFVDEVK